VDARCASRARADGSIPGSPYRGQPGHGGRWEQGSTFVIGTALSTRRTPPQTPFLRLRADAADALRGAERGSRGVRSRQWSRDRRPARAERGRRPSSGSPGPAGRRRTGAVPRPLFPRLRRAGDGPQSRHIRRLVIGGARASGSCRTDPERDVLRHRDGRHVLPLVVHATDLSPGVGGCAHDGLGNRWADDPRDGAARGDRGLRGARRQWTRVLGALRRTGRLLGLGRRRIARVLDQAAPAPRARARRPRRHESLPVVGRVGHRDRAARVLRSGRAVLVLHGFRDGDAVDPRGRSADHRRHDPDRVRPQRRRTRSHGPHVLPDRRLPPLDPRPPRPTR
jgi:hypothetical protein